jgi:formate-dependent nitrite reductase membrane component NrfD
MAHGRAPYGRRNTNDVAPTTPERRSLHRAYQGETYYQRPAIKPSHYGQLVASYLFVGGLAGAAQLIASIADLSGRRRDRPTVRAGRYLAVTGALVSPVLLIADLHTPRRWFNMLRIFRPTSAMSIGSWTLLGFGVLSGLTAIAQILDDLTGIRLFRRLGRWIGVPAAAAGGTMAMYTGTLLSSTSNSLWASGERFLPALFGASAISTATAALSLATSRDQSSAHRYRLHRLSLVAASTELVLDAVLWRRWRRQGVDTPLRQQPTAAAYRAGFWGLGLLLPLAVHGTGLLTRRHSQTASTLADIATLAGGYMLRSAVVSAGNASARRPEDYFRITQPRDQVAPPQRRRPSLMHQCEEAVEALDKALNLPPQQLGKEVDQVENMIVQMRDRLIEQLRQDGSSAAAAQWRTALEHLNAALSLVTGVEYPAAGIQRSSLEEARDVLVQVLEDHLLT